MMFKDGGRYNDWAPIFLRIATGVIFFAHGQQKLFGGLERTGDFLATLGLPLPQVFAIILAGVEFFGGALILIGLFTRYAALLLFIDMVVAIIMVHLPNGLTGRGGYEFPLTLLVSSMALMLLGSGNVSVEKTLLKREF